MATNDSTAAVSPNMASDHSSSAFKLRRIGRCASPPVWGCYELEATASDSDSQSQSDTDGAQSCDEDENGADGDDGKISIIVAPIDPANVPLPPSPPPLIVSMESSANLASDSTQPAPEPEPEPESNSSSNDQGSQEEGCADCDNKPKLDKGKGREVVVDSPPASTPQPTEQCTPGTPSSRKTRRSSRSSRRTPVYQPILTIRSSHGWIWNQDLFVPHYMKDRYVSYPPEPPSTDSVGVEYDCIGITLTPEDLGQVLPP